MLAYEETIIGRLVVAFSPSGLTGSICNVQIVECPTSPEVSIGAMSGKWRILRLFDPCPHGTKGGSLDWFDVVGVQKFGIS